VVSGRTIHRFGRALLPAPLVCCAEPVDDDVRLASALRREGHAYDGLARMVRAGELVKVRHGAYATAQPDDPAAAHRQLIAATLPRCGDVCLSHASAALLYGLPSWSADLVRVQVTKSRTSGGRRSKALHVHVAPLRPEEIATIDGLSVTSLARTTADCLRSYAYEKAVAIGDAAIRAGLSRHELAESVGQARNRVGSARARHLVGFVDGRSESVGESRSRIVLCRVGLPPGCLQFEVRDIDGRVVARTDFGWERERTVGEFDGRIKYGRLRRPGEDPEDAVFREKVREDRIRDLGFEVVRWTWSDLDQPQLLANRLRRAFSRGMRAVA
jgi:hypothetical protein